MNSHTVEIINGELRVNVYEFLKTLTDDQRSELIDALACRCEVIDEVINQVLDGCTSLGSHGLTGWGGNAEANSGLDGARMRIAKLSSDVAKDEIAALHRRIEAEKELGKKGWDAYHEATKRGY